MPLIVKDYKWRQSDNFVIIQVPLHGVHQSKVDLFTSPVYIKASFEKFFFEAFLLRSVNTAESKCTKTASEIVFELAKNENIEWESLEVDLSKAERLKLKKGIIEEEHLRFQEECKKKSDNKSELKRVAVREQISLDSKIRNKIEEIKVEEKSKALGDVRAWERSVEKSAPRIVKGSKKLQKSTLVPLPRKIATVHVDFTHRQFPTPCRESHLAEEEEWLRKQAEVRRSVGFVSEDLRAEEKNPQWLNAKGQEFLKAGNYLGAISAFSFAIKLCSEYPDLYIGRSEAHFYKENYFKCAQDCSSAVELLRPAVPSNLEQRVTCLTRKGLALRKMGFLRECINELEFALKLKPENQEVRDVLVDIKTELANQEENDEKNSNQLQTC
ncbi:hypothetical protein PPYR_10834 [Photinus pyralis]|uniref:CS domain-containing protein n=1 Tax=Photinus pyralis TaxID=7054 RepID=A0A5N4AHJ4_PHOPY|nr:dynein assembly factor 4, axonemal-like [Photinus pyralis]KAB0796773.1 hypothetical protein PPYR_10834 [Photinus pyralis]